VALSKKRSVLLGILLVIGVFRILASYRLIPISPYRFYISPLAQVFTLMNRFQQMRFDSTYSDGSKEIFEIVPGKKLRDAGLGYFSRQAFVALLLNSRGTLGNPGFKQRMEHYFCNQELGHRPRRASIEFLSRQSFSEEYKTDLIINCENL
jgi:hypothetical protein